MSTGQIISRTLGAKALSVRSRPGGGTIMAPEDPTTTPALSDAQIRALAALGRQVAALYDDTPQDIEWALANDTLYLLQARPITSLFPVPAGLTADPLRAMLSFGAVQGMLEPITPLGRNLIDHLVAAGAQLFGMTVKAETQNALFTAGERLWINLTPLLRNTVGRRIIPGITSWVDPGSGEALDAIWHDPRLQPSRHGISPGAARHIARAAVPLAGLVLLNLLYPDRRRRFIVGPRGAPAPRRGRALRRDPGRAPRPAGGVGCLCARVHRPAPAAHLSPVRLRRGQRHGLLQPGQDPDPGPAWGHR